MANILSRIWRSAVRLVWHDFWRKLIALSFAVLLYSVMIQEGGMREVKLSRVPVELLLPDDLVYTGEPKTVSISFRYDRRDGGDFANLKGQAEVKMSRFTSNVPYQLMLTRDNFDFPGRVRDVKITPDILSLKLERVISRRKGLRARFDSMSKLSSGYSVGEVDFVPAEVVVTGPEETVKNIDTVETAPIPLDRNVTENFDYGVRLELPENVSAKPSRVIARVGVSRNYADRAFRNLPLELMYGSDMKNFLRPEGELPLVEVIISGPAEKVRDLSPNAVHPYLDLSNLRESGKYNLSVNCMISGDGSDLSIRSISPQELPGLQLAPPETAGKDAKRK